MVRFNRLSSAEPEAYYVKFPIPCPGVVPRLSCGGQPFTPYTDQVPGSCRDYFAIDGWADYATATGHWLWVSRDAPLVTPGAPLVWGRRTDAPGDPQMLHSMVFNNWWYTNFVADEHGVMEFQYDLAWRARLDNPTDAFALATAITVEPVVLINDRTRDDPIVLDRLFKP